MTEPTPPPKRGGFGGWVDERIANAVPLVVNAVMDRFERELTELKDDILRIDNKLTDVARNMIGQVDLLDGKVGNLQEQLVGLPAQVIGSVTTAVEQAIDRLNPFNRFG